MRHRSKLLWLTVVETLVTIAVFIGFAGYNTAAALPYLWALAVFDVFLMFALLYLIMGRK